MSRFPLVSSLLVAGLVASATAAVAEPAADPQSWPALAAGEMEVRVQPGGVVIGAPHGGFDLYSEVIARQVANGLPAGFVLATGYRTREHPWNVNRPTAGVGLSPEAETHPREAREVFEVYSACVVQQHPSLYVEIHGDSRPQSAGAIEVALTGLGAEQGQALKAAMRQTIAQLPAGVPRVEVVVEGLDDVHFRAASAKAVGVFAQVPRGIQLELPVALRKDARARESYVGVIIAGLRAVAPSGAPVPSGS